MNIGWRDKALRRAVLLSLLLLVACGYCLYQFHWRRKAHNGWRRCRGRHTSSSNCRLACRRAPLREQLPERLRRSAQAYHSHRRPDGK